MKFNMGCGRRKLSDFINVDLSPVCEPDEMFDLEKIPWPWPSNCAEEIQFSHSLEHLGATADIFLSIMTEIYRIARNKCLVRIRVPHPRHDDFIDDPTHVRAITPQLLQLFDRDANDRWAELGASNTPFAHYLGVDFRILSCRSVPAEPYRTQLLSNEITEDELAFFSRSLNNVIKEFRIKMEVRK